MGIPLPPGYDWQVATSQDPLWLVQSLQANYQELFPEQTNWHHLGKTVHQHWDPRKTPCWWITPRQETNRIGSLWVSPALDQWRGYPIAYILLLRVDPGHRRQGIGRALLQQAETWAAEHGMAGLQLQVFCRAQAALALYDRMGFNPEGTWLHKPLQA